MKIDQLNSPIETVVEKSNIIPIDEYFDEMYLTESEKEERKDLAKNIFVILSAILTIIKANQVLGNDHDIEYYKDYISSNLEILFDNIFGAGSYRSLIENFANEFVDSTMRHIDTPYFTSDDRATVNAEQQSNSVFNQKAYDDAVASGKTKKTWLTMHDKRVRNSHVEADGQEVDINKPFEVGSSELMFPGDLSLGSSLKEICNCRCVCIYSGNQNIDDSSDKDVIFNENKITAYLLNPQKPHYNEFISVGYNENEPEKLKSDILSLYDYNKAKDIENTEHGQKFSVFMDLGITSKKEFRTVWQIDNGAEKPRFITAYIDRRK